MSERCPVCNSIETERQHRKEVWEHKGHPIPVEYNCWYCRNCKESWIDYDDPFKQHRERRNRMMVIGIDVGFSGAIAIWKEGMGFIKVVDMPVMKDGKHTELDEQEIVDMLDSFGNENMHAFIEKAQSMPGQGISSTGRYLMSFGQLRGICAGLDIPYTLVHPRTWKSAMMPDMPKEKEASIIRAKQLFPDITFSRKKDHGRADACLIAEYGRRTLV